MLSHTAPIETNSFSKIPDDNLLEVIASFLNSKELNELSLTNKNLNQLFQPQLKINRLLLQVARGKQQEAEELLKENTALLLAKGSITDYAGRVFENITAFQLALWNLDRHMWQMLLNYLSPEAAIKQLQEHEDENNKPHYIKTHGKHYDFSPLMTALQVYVNYCAFRNVRQFTWEGREALWQQVGLAQRSLPAHALQEYCRPDRSFHPTPTFKDKNLVRTLHFHLFKEDGLRSRLGPYRRGSDPCPSLFDRRVNLVLGSDFSLYRDGWLQHYGSPFARASVKGPLFSAANHDLEAMAVLAGVRMQEMTELKELLGHTKLERRASQP